MNNSNFILSNDADVNALIELAINNGGNDKYVGTNVEHAVKNNVANYEVYTLYGKSPVLVVYHNESAEHPNAVSCFAFNGNELMYYVVANTLHGASNSVLMECCDLCDEIQ